MTMPPIQNRSLFRQLVWKRNVYLCAGLVLGLAWLYVLSILRIRLNGEGDGVRLLGYLFQLQPFSWWSLLWFGIFVAMQLVFMEIAMISLASDKAMIPLYPRDKSKRRMFGKLRGSEIVKMTQELAEQLGLKKIAKIAVYDQRPDANAMTAHVFGLGNVIILHSNLLEILPSHGVRSVIAHELAHVRNWDFRIYQLVRLPMVFAWVIAVLALFPLFAGFFPFPGFWLFLGRLLFVAFLLWLTTRVFWWIRALMFLAMQQSELIADAHAAEKVGWLEHLNALLLIGERSQALDTLRNALAVLPATVEAELNDTILLRLLNRFPQRELDENVARDMAVRIFIQDRLELLKDNLCVPLSDREIFNLSIKGSRAYEERVAEDPALQNYSTNDDEADANLANWRDYDVDASGHLDDEEITVLVEELRRYPHRMMFRVFLAADAKWKTHPPIRARILCLHDLFVTKN